LSPDPTRELEVRTPLPPVDDLTIYLAEDSDQPLLRNLTKDKTLFEIEHPVILSTSGSKIAGRAHVCYAFEREYIASTLRLDDPIPQSRGNPPLANRSTSFAPKPLTKDSLVESLGKDTTGFLSGTQELCDSIWQQVTSRETADQRGLIVVCGRTGVCKSQIARGIIHNLIREYWEKVAAGIAPKRNFHLVTIEDPIEKRLVSRPEEAQELWIDYTPRLLDTDVESIAAGLRGAKRQTTSVVYIGEVRREEEWVDILRFVEGGHTVVATTHAGSVVECFHKLMGDSSASPSHRSRIAELVRAVIHLQADDISLDDVPLSPQERRRFGTLKQIKAVIPALWRKTPQGTASFVSNGYSAILPGFTGQPSLRAHLQSTLNPEPNEAGSIGRRWFARDIATRVAKTYRAALHDSSQTAFEKLAAEIERRATLLDLRGL